jgi:orotidine-5'-phosphate decarboxylase
VKVGVVVTFAAVAVTFAAVAVTFVTIAVPVRRAAEKGGDVVTKLTEQLAIHIQADHAAQGRGVLPSTPPVVCSSCHARATG